MGERQLAYEKQGKNRLPETTWGYEHEKQTKGHQKW